jgi:phosphoribosylanthranilate isomerase
VVKVKICGITNLEDALNAADAGADALGFVFYKKSPRYIAPEKASAIIRHLAPGVLKVDVFVDAREKELRKAARLCRLDMLQLHGKESPAFCRKLSDLKVIKAFCVKNKPLEPPGLLKYATYAYLFDTFAGSRRGGSGKKFNWRLVRHLEGLGRPVFLSGGLNAKNVKLAISIVQPDWVDVSSSLEVEPGKKDNKKVKEFIRAVKS